MEAVQLASVNCPFSLNHRLSEAPAPEGGLLSSYPAFYSALTWALAESLRGASSGSWGFPRGAAALLRFLVGAEPAYSHILPKRIQKRRQQASNSVQHASKVGV